MKHKMYYYFNTPEHKEGNKAYNEARYEDALNAYRKIYDTLHKYEYHNNELLDERAYVAAEIIITQLDIIASQVDAAEVFEYENDITTRWHDIQEVHKHFLNDYKASRGVVHAETSKDKVDDVNKRLASMCEMISDAYSDDTYATLEKSLEWMQRCIVFRKHMKKTVKTIDIYLSGLYLSEKLYEIDKSEQHLVDMEQYLALLMNIATSLYHSDTESGISYYRLFIAIYRRSDELHHIATECRTLLAQYSLRDMDGEQSFLEDMQRLLSGIPDTAPEPIITQEFDTVSDPIPAETAIILSAEMASPKRHIPVMTDSAAESSRIDSELETTDLCPDESSHVVMKRKLVDDAPKYSNPIIQIAQAPGTKSAKKAKFETRKMSTATTPLMPAYRSPAVSSQFFVQSIPGMASSSSGKVSVPLNEANQFVTSLAMSQYLKQKKQENQVRSCALSSETSSATQRLFASKSVDTSVSMRKTVSYDVHCEAFLFACENFKQEHAQNNFKLQAHLLCLIAHYYAKSPEEMLERGLLRSRYTLAVQLYQAASRLAPQSQSTELFLKNGMRQLVEHNQALPLAHLNHDGTVEHIFTQALNTHLADVRVLIQPRQAISAQVMQGILDYLQAESPKNPLGRQTSDRIKQLRDYYEYQLGVLTQDISKVETQETVSSASSSSADDSYRHSMV